MKHEDGVGIRVYRYILFLLVKTLQLNPILFARTSRSYFLFIYFSTLIDFFCLI